MSFLDSLLHIQPLSQRRREPATGARRKKTIPTALIRSLRSRHSDTAEDGTVFATKSDIKSDPRTYFARDVTRDGCIIAIRAIRPDDKGRLCEHFRSLSPTSAYFRFFTPKRQVSERELADLTAIDFLRKVTLVATVRSRRAERIVGLAQYVVLDDR